MEHHPFRGRWLLLPVQNIRLGSRLHTSRSGHFRQAQGRRGGSRGGRGEPDGDREELREPAGTPAQGARLAGAMGGQLEPALRLMPHRTSVEVEALCCH